MYQTARQVLDEYDGGEIQGPEEPFDRLRGALNAFIGPDAAAAADRDGFVNEFKANRAGLIEICFLFFDRDLVEKVLAWLEIAGQEPASSRLTLDRNGHELTYETVRQYVPGTGNKGWYWAINMQGNKNLKSHFNEDKMYELWADHIHWD